MSRLLRRIKRAHRTSADDLEPQSSATAASVAAAHEASAESGSDSPLLAGQDPADARPTALRRGRLRKRLRYLERERELLLRDLGGLVYEIHRTGVASEREHHRELVSGKVQRLAALDGEHGSGLASLRETRGETVLREPGVGGLCPNCGELFGSDARFCSACGTPVAAAQATPPEPPAITTAPETSDLVLPPAEEPRRPAGAMGSGESPAGLHRASLPRPDDPVTEFDRPASRPVAEPVTEIDSTQARPPGHPKP